MVDRQQVLYEGPLWSTETSLWHFVDILDGSFLQYDGATIEHIFSGEEPLSNVIPMPSGFLISGQNHFFSYVDGKLASELCLDPGKALRCNDGSVGPDGRYYFGTMEIMPTGLNGKLYTLDTGGNVSMQGEGIGIPNTFAWLDDSQVLISDSLLQKTFKVKLLGCGTLDWPSREVWLDLSHTNMTPDGGAVDQDGNIWLAIWGGACIHKYSPDAQLLEKVELRALQPTSCAFGGRDMNELLITTATEGITEEQIKKYPDSGKVLLRKMDVKGRIQPIFHLGGAMC